MIKFEHKHLYDAYGSGNYTENKEETFSSDITEERARQFANLLLEMCCFHYETSKAHFFEKDIDARHYEQYIFYK